MADFDKTLDAGNPNDVTLTQLNAAGARDIAPLEIFVDGPGDANRLLVFSGLAITDIVFSEDDEIMRRGVVRVRLRFPLSDAMRFISSATSASLASIANADDDEDTTFAVDDAVTAPAPTNPNDPGSPLELVLTAHLAVQGGATGVISMAYQANVLIHDSTPDVDQVLVSDETGTSFGPSALITVGHRWSMKVVLTGKNLSASPFPYTVSTSDPVNVPIDVLDSIQEVPSMAQEAAKLMIDPVGNQDNRTATITVRGRNNVRTATIKTFVVK